MRESMRILKHLIINNSINDRDDAELFVWHLVRI